MPTSKNLSEAFRRAAKLADEGRHAPINRAAREHGISVMEMMDAAAEANVSLFGEGDYAAKLRIVAARLEAGQLEAVAL